MMSWMSSVDLELLQIPLEDLFVSELSIVVVDNVFDDGLHLIVSRTVEVADHPGLIQTQNCLMLDRGLPVRIGFGWM